ncbi:MAG: DUF4376 domain-containing protein [Alphaproteobacteria bacterium]|nr:MAG: DUF4376 domain-containing protein [Alphaproteobacteria bacterium]
MILIRRRKGGELASVETAEGYDLRKWEVLGPIPAGVDPMLAVHEGGAIVNNLQVPRAERWRQVKERRAAAELGGCMIAQGRIETSEASQRRLHTFVTQAIAQGEAFVPIAWKLADNRIAVLDAQAIVAAHLAAAGHVAACHARAQELREMIGAAGSIEEIVAVDVDQGWPG